MKARKRNLFRSFKSFCDVSGSPPPGISYAVVMQIVWQFARRGRYNCRVLLQANVHAVWTYYSTFFLSVVVGYNCTKLIRLGTSVSVPKNNSNSVFIKAFGFCILVALYTKKLQDRNLVSGNSGRRLNRLPILKIKKHRRISNSNCSINGTRVPIRRMRC